MRISSLPYSNIQTQGAQRRQWLTEHSPQHLEQCTALMRQALRLRQAGVSRGTVVFGAGACTEVPVADLASASDELVLVDLDVASMQLGYKEIPASSLRRRTRLVEADITGGVSHSLQQLLKRQAWDKLKEQGVRAIFDAAASCLEQCAVPDPPEIATLAPGDFGLVVSSLVLSQLFSYPLLDILDHIQSVDPDMLVEQERHRRYQEAAQNFRIRIIEAHLHLLRELLDRGGIAVLLSDIRGFVFNVYGTDHDAVHRRAIPLVPRVLPDLIRQTFTVVEERQWEWIADLPQNDKLGRGYEVSGYILQVPAAKP